jgi:hypothetical protein
VRAFIPLTFSGFLEELEKAAEAMYHISRLKP